jgi:hypothetical protein
MKKWAVLVLVLGGCTIDLVPPEEELRGYKRSELEAGPSNIGMHAAILSDVRRERVLDRHLEEGVPTCTALKYAAGKTMCVADETEMTVFELRRDLLDQPYRVDETAYFCSKEGVYYYHYEGGTRKLDVWLGPFRIDRPGRKLDDLK